MPDQASGETFTIFSLYGAHSHRALVQIEIPPAIAAAGHAVISTHEARALAWNLLSAAESADQDGFVVQFLAGAMEPEKQAQVLRAFRDWRTADRARARSEGREGA